MFTWLGLLEASAVGAICIALFFLLSQLFGERYRAGFRKVVWLLIALRMCIPISTAIFPKPVTVQVPVYVLQDERPRENVNPVPVDGEKADEEGPAEAAPTAGGAQMINTDRRQFTSQDILVLLWSVGAVGMLSFFLLSHYIFCRKMMRRSRRCADRNILRMTAELAKELELRRMPRLRLISGVQTGPFTVGFFRNTVFLPEDDYQERDLRYIIRHELVHCAGWDTQFKVLLGVVNALHWFNPLVWLMRNLVDQDMELACDERVLETCSREARSEYSELLMSCIGTDEAGRSALSTGYVQGVKFIKRRFRNIFNMHKKRGKAIGCIMIAALMLVSAGIGFQAGRTVYARSRIVIDQGIELRTDVTGDGRPDRVVVYDDTGALTASVGLESADGRSAWILYDEEEVWTTSYLVCGDLSGNGTADIVLMRITYGMHLTGWPSVLHVAEESGELAWQEYPEVFLPNPAIGGEQPTTFADIDCTDATIVEKDGQHILRLIAVDWDYFSETGDDSDQVLCIDCSWQDSGWYIEDMRTVKGYLSENKKDELLKNNIFAAPQETQAPQESQVSGGYLEIHTIEGYTFVDGNEAPVEVTINVESILRGEEAYSELCRQSPDIQRPDEDEEYLIVNFVVTYREGTPDTLYMTENRASLPEAALYFALPDGESNAHDMTSYLENAIYDLAIEQGQSAQGAVAFRQKQNNEEQLSFVGFETVTKFRVN